MHRFLLLVKTFTIRKTSDLNELQSSEFFRHVEAVAHWGLPSDFVAGRWQSLTSEKINTKRFALRCWACIDCEIGNRHCAIPHPDSLIDSRRNLESRIPIPAAFGERMVEIYIEIDAFAARRDFKFLVTANIYSKSEPMRAGLELEVLHLS
jgi:hypothetical protein